jgi:hypothetical protein
MKAVFASPRSSLAKVRLIRVIYNPRKMPLISKIKSFGRQMDHGLTRNVHAETKAYRSCMVRDPIAHCISPSNAPGGNLKKASTKSLASCRDGMQSVMRLIGVVRY